MSTGAPPPNTLLLVTRGNTVSFTATVANTPVAGLTGCSFAFTVKKA